jgi:protein O-mannosyl-transferase
MTSSAQQPGAPAPQSGPGSGLDWGYVVLIFLAVLAAYSPALRSGFIWDDDAHVTAAALQSWAGLGRIWGVLGATQQYYPVLHSAFWVEHRLWGEAPLGYHLTNVCLHAAAACLFALVLRRLAVPGPRLAGAIFALHPLAVESVAWISEEKNTLSLVCYLLAALAYFRFEEKRSVAPYLWATGLFVLALLSKSVTATLPAALLVVAWWQHGRLSWRREILPLLPWLVLAGASGLLTAWVERRFIGAEGPAFSLGLFGRCLLAGRVIWFYLAKLLWPAGLMFIYPRWNLAANPGLGVGLFLAALGATVLLWLLRRRTRGPLAGWLCFVGSLFPALGFFNVYPFIFSYVADHFQYLADLGVVALAGAGAAEGLARLAPRLRDPSRGVAGLFLLGLALLTWRQCLRYRDAETLYTVTLRENPDAWLAQLNLGNIDLERGRTAEAIARYQSAEQLAPDYPSTHFNLGRVWLQAGRLPEAIAENEADLRLVPADAEARNNLGIALAESGRTAEAEIQFQEALRLRPDYPRARANLEALHRMAESPRP